MLIPWNNEGAFLNPKGNSSRVEMSKTSADIEPSGIVKYGKEARNLNFKVGDWALVTL